MTLVSNSPVLAATPDVSLLCCVMAMLMSPIGPSTMVQNGVKRTSFGRIKRYLIPSRGQYVAQVDTTQYHGKLPTGQGACCAGIGLITLLGGRMRGDAGFPSESAGEGNIPFAGWRLTGFRTWRTLGLGDQLWGSPSAVTMTQLG